MAIIKKNNEYCIIENFRIVIFKKRKRFTWLINDTYSEQFFIHKIDAKTDALRSLLILLKSSSHN